MDQQFSDVAFGDVPPPCPWEQVPDGSLDAYMRAGVPEAFTEYRRRWEPRATDGTPS